MAMLLLLPISTVNKIGIQHFFMLSFSPLPPWLVACVFSSIIWGLFIAEGTWAKVATLGVQGNLTNNTPTALSKLIGWYTTCATHSRTHTNIHINTPAAAAAAAMFAVLPLLWKGLVGAAAGGTPAATNGLVDWAVGERHQVTKHEQRVWNRTIKCTDLTC